MAQAESWRNRAKCKDLAPGDIDDLFFPSTGGKSKRAKEFCMGCPVRRFCADAGLLGNEEFGIWGAQRADDLRLIAKNTEKVEQVRLRHPENIISYLGYLPSGEEEEIVEPSFEIDFDELENPLDDVM